MEEKRKQRLSLIIAKNTMTIRRHASAMIFSTPPATTYRERS
jgi:hypothetical protein